MRTIRVTWAVWKDHVLAGVWAVVLLAELLLFFALLAQE